MCREECSGRGKSVVGEGSVWSEGRKAGGGAGGGGDGSGVEGMGGWEGVDRGATGGWGGGKGMEEVGSVVMWGRA